MNKGMFHQTTINDTLDVTFHNSIFFKNSTVKRGKLNSTTFRIVKKQIVDRSKERMEKSSEREDAKFRPFGALTEYKQKAAGSRSIFQQLVGYCRPIEHQ